MHKAIIAAMAAASIIALGACNKQGASNETAAGGNASAPAAAGDINGTWKADINSVQFDTKPDDYLLQAAPIPASPARRHILSRPTAPSIR